MLTHPTLDQLNTLGLHGIAKAFLDADAAPESGALSHAEWLALLLDHEAAWRMDKRLNTRMRYAKLRQQASPEDIDYRAARGLDRALFHKLLTCAWIDAHDGVLICGVPDTRGRGVLG
jgi:DNA replication protein DnaC